MPKENEQPEQEASENSIDVGGDRGSESVEDKVVNFNANAHNVPYKYNDFKERDNGVCYGGRHYREL